MCDQTIIRLHLPFTPVPLPDPRQHRDLPLSGVILLPVRGTHVVVLFDGGIGEGKALYEAGGGSVDTVVDSHENTAQHY